MRNCIRCKCEMAENHDVKVEGGAYGLKITKQGLFKDNLGKVHAAVCPKCGYLEFYLDDLSKINKQGSMKEKSELVGMIKTEKQR